MPIAPGARIDEYEVLDLLGAGGMGEVYRVRDPVLKRDIAIKVLPASVAQDPVRLQRFEQEAQAAAALNHPNILVIYRFGSYAGAPYLASELLEGATLRQQLGRGPMAVQNAVDTGVQIARGLGAAHDKGIVHRDLKPENLFVTGDGRVKILDFGLAKLMYREPRGDGTTITQHTDPGTVMGTAGYMSPEQVRGAAVDHRADIFALGAILYEMVTGKRAFQRSTTAEAMTAILNEDPPGISRVAQLTSPGLQRVVKRCLEKNPEQRFQSASDLAFALEALSDSSGQVASSPSVPNPPVGRGAQLARWIAVAAALLMIGYLVLGELNESPGLRVTGYSQLTHSGNAGDVISTDGVRIYLTEGLGGHSLSLVDVSGGEIEKFTKLPPRSYPLNISPDGTTLLYMVYQAGVTQTAPLYSLKVLGGSPRYLRSVSEADWSPDGNSIVYNESKGDIFQMNVDGTNSHKLISTGGQVTSFTLSPDGKRIRYFDDRNALWEATSSGTGRHQLLREWHPGTKTCCGTWSPDGSIFVFRASPGRQMWALDERNTLFHKPSGQPTPLTSSPTRWGTPVFSKDGKRIFCTGSMYRGELIRFDKKSGQFLPFLGGISADLLSFSRDGQSVAYISYPDYAVWKSNVDGTGQLQLSAGSFHAESVSLSPDGSQVLFMAPAPGSNIIRAYIVSSQGQGPRLLLPKSSGPETDPNWSPDGHRIVFSTTRVREKTAGSEIRILDVDSQQVTTLPNSAGKFSPSWSPNSQFLLASSVDIGKLYVFEWKTSRWTEIYKGISGYVSWSRDSRFVYTLRYASEPAILRVSVNGGVPELVADLKDVRFTGTLGIWMGLDTTDAPLLLRDVGASDVYALSLEYK